MELPVLLAHHLIRYWQMIDLIFLAAPLKPTRGLMGPFSVFLEHVFPGLSMAAALSPSLGCDREFFLTCPHLALIVQWGCPGCNDCKDSRVAGDIAPQRIFLRRVFQMPVLTLVFDRHVKHGVLARGAGLGGLPPGYRCESSGTHKKATCSFLLFLNLLLS